INMHAFLLFRDRENSTSRPDDSLELILNEIPHHDGVLECYTYSLVGLRPEVDFCVWVATEHLEAIQSVAAAFHRAGFPLAHSLWGYIKPSQYTGQSGITIKVPGPRRPYLVIYPFVKTHEWYQMNHEERREMMKEHIAVGKKYEGIDQLLVYSVGLSDGEFVVAYETDDIVYFSGLVAALRETKGRIYTERDTPIFTCRYAPVEELLKHLRASHAAEPAGTPR
ncbi:MAG: chlorite dismutase family protein, partial [bacterium]